MDGCCHGDNLRILLINRHKSCIVIVSSPDPTPYREKGLVTFEGFLGFQNGGVEECERANQIVGLRWIAKRLRNNHVTSVWLS